MKNLDTCNNITQFTHLLCEAVNLKILEKQNSDFTKKYYTLPYYYTTKNQ